MYFPYFFSGQHEAQTVFKLKKEILKKEILPIFEISKVSNNFNNEINKVVLNEIPFILVQNSMIEITDEVEHRYTIDLINSLMNINNNKIIPGIYINPDNIDELNFLLEKFQNQEIVLFHTKKLKGKLLEEVLRTISKYNIKYNILLQEATNYKYRESLINYSNVIIEDHFIKRTPNSAYKKHVDEPFHNLHITFKLNGYSGFGDYLTIGNSPITKRANAPSTIVIHYTYPEGIEKENIRIRRFFGEVSSGFKSQSDARYQAMVSLKEYIEEEIKEECSYCNSCIDLLKEIKKEKSYSLGRLKQFSMLHHSYMMVKLLKM